MAAGDTLRRITPQDQLILNAAGQVVGIKNPNANGADFYFDPNALALGAAAGAIGAGVRVGPSLSDYSTSNPLYIAHRGSAALYPEESKLAYDNALFANGETALETDVQTLSDGSLGLMHDGTVDRTTTGTGAVNTFSSTTFQALTMDSSVWLGSNYGDTLNPMMFQAMIDAYKGKAILVPEDKDFVSMAALVRALINSGVSRTQALVQCFTAANLATPVAAGYPALGLSTGNSPTAAAIAATGAQYAAVGTADSLTPFIAAGLKTLVYTVNRRYLRDQFLAQGAMGFFSDDPTYLRANGAASTTDSFAWQTWIPGMLASDSDTGLLASTRGVFSAPNYWGYSSNANGYLGCLMGFLSPVANPQNFTLTLKATYDTVFAGTSSMSVFIGMNDKPFQNGTEAGVTGYLLMWRPVTGILDIYRKDSGAVPTKIGTVTGVGIGTTEFTYQITVTPTTLTLARTSGTNQYSLTVTDSTYRGGYIQLGRDGIGGRFRSLQVS